MQKIQFEPSKENITLDDNSRTVYQYCNVHGTPIFKTRELVKIEAKIVLYPYRVNLRTDEIRLQKIKRVELVGWNSFDDLPSDFKKTTKSETFFRINSYSIKQIISTITRKFPEVETLIIGLNTNTRFSRKTVAINWIQLESILKQINAERNYFNKNRKLLINNGFSVITGKFSKIERDIHYNELRTFLNKFDSFGKLTESDIQSLSELLDILPKSKISITANFIKTKDNINIAYLEDIVTEFDKLINQTNDNEKKWQDFFEKHSWIFSHIFPYEVILRQREAYVGGKTIENKDGKVVDFLFENGFRDNYALIEIKTHQKTLLKTTAYRGTDVYAISEDLSGGINQCLDQKDNFTKEFGKKYESFEPKTILIIGRKSSLTNEQIKCFELFRANQKNVEIVTFDELQKKIEGLLKVIKIK